MAILRNGRKPLTRAPWRGGKSLAVELPGVVRRGASVPRRTKPKRVSAALAERTGFDRFDIDIDTESRQCIYIKP